LLCAVLLLKKRNSEGRECNPGDYLIMDIIGYRLKSLALVSLSFRKGKCRAE